jgi:hypothetical protein
LSQRAFASATSISLFSRSSRLSLGLRFSSGQRHFPRESSVCAAAIGAAPQEAQALPQSPAFEQQPQLACATEGFASPQVLPDFPSIDEFPSGSCISPDKIQTLTMMYRAHCQRVMESVNKFSFSEVSAQRSSH